MIVELEPHSVTNVFYSVTFVSPPTALNFKFDSERQAVRSCQENCRLRHVVALPLLDLLALLQSLRRSVSLILIRPLLGYPNSFHIHPIVHILIIRFMQLTALHFIQTSTRIMTSTILMAK